MSLPQSNARLLSVMGDGASPDWDQAAGPGEPEWSGDTGVYVIDKVSTSFTANPGSLTKIRDTRVIVPAAMRTPGGDLAFKTGLIITYRWRGANHTRRVLDVDAAELPGVSRYVRLHLEPAPVEA